LSTMQRDQECAYKKKVPYFGKMVHGTQTN
jgi:hypothetical protein